MTDCTNDGLRELLPDFLNGGLDAEPRAMVVAHVARCAACANELALLESARALMHRAPSVDVGRIVAALPRPAAAAPRELVLVDGNARPRVRRPTSWRPLAMAASLLLAAGVTGVAVQRFTGDAGRVPAPATRAPVAPDVATGDGMSGASSPTTAPVATAAEGGGAAPSALLAVNVASMSDAEVEGLLAELDALDALPAEEPQVITMVPGAVDDGNGQL